MNHPAIRIESVARDLGIHSDHVELYGHHSAKISLSALEKNHPQGKLILVSAMTPTPAGEGKTTVSIGLAQGLKKIGKKAALALRQPSMGPVFGRKGTATGGGKSTLTPADSINLHFTGDFHAITTAHNLLAAAIDNGLHYKTVPLDPSKVLWKRVMDMNDRALRKIQVGLSEPASTGRTTGFDITAASEIMAILCLSESYEGLQARLDRMMVGFTPELKPVLASEIRITGAIMSVLREALKPNLVQSVEGVPAFVHGGPFANIAHGCNSVIATRMALQHAEYTVTEAGFAFDLGGEKFMSIKCRQSGLSPDVIVLVATVRALKMHGGVPLSELEIENSDAVKRGLENLHAHLDAARFFKRPVIVALNRFLADTAAEISVIQEFCDHQQFPFAVTTVFSEGGEGAIRLAECVAEAAQIPSHPLPFIYSLKDSVKNKIEKIAEKIYGADGVDFTADAVEKLKLIADNGLSDLPICMAKTQDSLSDNSKAIGRPSGFRITIRDFEIARGAGFLVALTGKLLRMPALPKIPAAEKIQMDSSGVISGW